MASVMDDSNSSMTEVKTPARETITAVPSSPKYTRCDTPPTVPSSPTSIQWDPPETWSPELNHRPPNPYVQGTTLEIRSHIPPPPELFFKGFEGNDLEEIRTVTSIERCLRRPALELDSIGAKVSSLTIIEHVRVYNRGAQIVAVKVPEVAGNETLIAKIYDPLYYEHGHPMDIDADPFRVQERDYAHETAVYDTLGPLQGNGIPKYYGSYTCTFSGPDWTRPVCLILISFIPGVCMRDLDPRDVPQATRQTIMRKIVEIDTEMHMHGVNHRDINPRNYIIRLNKEQSQLEQVVSFDFGNSRTEAMIAAHFQTERPTGIRISPFLRWNKLANRYRQFESPLWIGGEWLNVSWVDWDWQSWLESWCKNSDYYAEITPEMDEKWLGSYRYTPDETDRWFQDYSNNRSQSTPQSDQQLQWLDKQNGECTTIEPISQSDQLPRSWGKESGECIIFDSTYQSDQQPQSWGKPSGEETTSDS